MTALEHPLSVPADAPARDRIVSELDRTLFVEAGAGSGKTSSLVGRFVALVLAGADAGSIAAITFTEAAAAELRARIREALEDVVAGRAVRGVVTDDRSEPRARAALADLDRSTISTLHAFAQRLLTSAPVEAGLPPRIEVHDESSSALRADERWHRFVYQLLDRDDLEVALSAALALDVTTDHLAAVASVLNQNWDLLVGLDLDADRAPIDLDDIALSIEPIRRAVRHIDTLAATCTDPDDKLLGWIREDMRRSLEPVLAVRDQPYRLLQATAAIPKCTSNGRKASWPGDGKRAVQTAWSDAKAEIETAREAIADRVLRRLAVELADHTLQEAAVRRHEGRLEFHDLLVLARQVLRDDRRVRRRMHDRYQHLLIDEFQDTDPIQVELAVRIAADPDHDTTLAWDRVEVPEGRLFFVGDPKQSIYRFRRADIDLFVRTAERHAGGATRLHTNFRTVAPIVAFVNDLFGQLITRTAVDDGDDPSEVAQPAYGDLTAWRPAIPADPGPPVLLVGHPEPEATAASSRAAEASDIAAALARAETEGWLVHPEGEASPRACRWGDMAVLLPSRTSLPHLRRALAAEGVPYRLETGSLVYATTEVRDLLAILRAIDDPGDEVAVLGALRSPAYGCGDDDLLAWKRAGRPWTTVGTHLEDPGPDGPVPDEHGPDEHGPLGAIGLEPVRRALLDLRARHRARSFQTVPEIVDSVIRDRRLLEISLGSDDHRDAWRLYRVLSEHARQFADTDAGGLRDFLGWAALQADDKLRVSVPVLPEADVDAVRIMTVHGAKGLEFGITAVSGLSGQFPNRVRGAMARFRPGGGFDVRMRKGLETAQFDARRTVEDVMDEHEGIRLLYVALTRARDHLVVSVHHKPTKNGKVNCHARRIAAALDDLAADGWQGAGVARVEGTSAHRDDHDGDVLRPIQPVAPVGARVTDEAVEEWQTASDRWRLARERLLAGARGGGAVAATALGARVAALEGPSGDAARHAAAGDDGARTSAGGAPTVAFDDAPGEVAEPWRRGRGGTAVGSAVHAVLQHADLCDPTGADIPALAARHARVEGAADAAADIEAKARAALGSDLVRRAVRGRWWREVHVAVPVAALLAAAGGAGDGHPVGSVDLVEGFVDLLFEDHDGALVVVDYKTDALAGGADVGRALTRYAPQGATYALAVEAATERTVREVHFLFLRGDEAVDALVTDLDDHKARIAAALAAWDEPR